MRLSLDKHFSPEIARQLRDRGHDVVAVGEHADLRGRADRVRLVAAPDQRRAIVTHDLADFRPLLTAALRSGTKTYGVICVPTRFALSREGIGAMVRALEALLESHPEDDAIIKRGGEAWLDDPRGSRA